MADIDDTLTYEDVLRQLENVNLETSAKVVVEQDVDEEEASPKEAAGEDDLDPLESLSFKRNTKKNVIESSSDEESEELSFSDDEEEAEEEAADEVVTPGEIDALFTLTDEDYNYNIVARKLLAHQTLPSEDDVVAIKRDTLTAFTTADLIAAWKVYKKRNDDDDDEDDKGPKPPKKPVYVAKKRADGKADVTDPDNHYCHWILENGHHCPYMRIRGANPKQSLYCNRHNPQTPCIVDGCKNKRVNMALTCAIHPTPRGQKDVLDNPMARDAPVRTLDEEAPEPDEEEGADEVDDDDDDLEARPNQCAFVDRDGTRCTDNKCGPRVKYCLFHNGKHTCKKIFTKGPHKGQMCGVVNPNRPRSGCSQFCVEHAPRRKKKSSDES